jgi:hypothetical protein
LEDEILEEMTSWTKENDVELVCSDHSDGVRSEISVTLKIAALIFDKFLV